MSVFGHATVCQRDWTGSDVHHNCIPHTFWLYMYIAALMLQILYISVQNLITMPSMFWVIWFLSTCSVKKVTSFIKYISNFFFLIHTVKSDSWQLYRWEFSMLPGQVLLLSTIACWSLIDCICSDGQHVLYWSLFPSIIAWWICMPVLPSLTPLLILTQSVLPQSILTVASWADKSNQQLYKNCPPIPIFYLQ